MTSKPTCLVKHALVCLAGATLFLLTASTFAQERPFDTTTCGLLLHPDKYDGGLVSVDGFVTVGPDEFMLHDASCGDASGKVWLQFAGDIPSPGGGGVSRGVSGKPRTVEGLQLPLNKDRDFDAMEKLLQEAQKSGKTKMLRATLIGKYFPGKPTKTVTGEEMRSGYGRVGCCSLLMIQEVVKVDSGLEEPVDFSPVSNIAPRMLRKGCTVTNVPLAPHEDEDQLERKSLEDEYQYLHDPKKVAARAVAVQAGLDADEVERHLQSESATQSVASYLWNSIDGTLSFHVVVNKPYWLLQTAASGDAVVWAPKQMSKAECAADTNSPTNPISPIPTIPHKH
jgi:hypothetical protein